MCFSLRTVGPGWPHLNEQLSQSGKHFTSGILSVDEGMIQAPQQVRKALKVWAVSRAAGVGV